MTRACAQTRRTLSAALLGVAVLISGCATPPAPRDFGAFRKADPKSILVLPPVNATPDVSATPSVYAQVTFPLAESGYYVLPVSLVDQTLKLNGIQTANDAREIPTIKLREIFGADAVLYLTVKRYGSVYQVLTSDAVVTLEAKLVDLRDGQLLWEGVATASSAEQRGSNQAGLLGMLIQAVVEQIVDAVVERSHPIAGLASNRLLLVGQPGGILPGPRSPLRGGAAGK